MFIVGVLVERHFFLGGGGFGSLFEFFLLSESIDGGVSEKSIALNVSYHHMARLRFFLESFHTFFIIIYKLRFLSS